MKHVLVYISLALLLTQCGPKEQLPTGAPPKIKTGALRDSVLNNQNKPTTFAFKAAARVESPELANQSFRLEARVLTDSLIWLDFADPILGIKVARAVLYNDSVAFYNRLERNYLTGNISDFKTFLNFDFDFFDLQAILLGNVVFKDLQKYEQYPMAYAYKLANFEQDPQKQQNTPINQEQYITLQFAPALFKAQVQELTEPVNGKRYSLFYDDFVQEGDMHIPQRIKIEYTGKSLNTLNLQIQQVYVNQNLNVPFSIPANYAPIK